MKRVTVALLISWSSFAFSQSCPDVADKATQSYSATFSGADIQVLRDRWSDLQGAIATCELLRGKPISLREELGEDFFNRLKSPEQVLEARDIRNRAPKIQYRQGKGLLVNAHIFKRLTNVDQDALLNKYPLMEVVDAEAVAKVLSHQIINSSVPGDDSGSRLGSVVGQASYIDRSISGGTYSAMGQVGAGLVGALLGAALDRPERRSFTINYGVQTIDGSVKAIARISATGLASPVGQCVWTARMSEAPSYLCNDTLVAFLGRLKTHAANVERSNSADLPTTELIKCTVPGVGDLTVQADECKALKGQPAN